MKNLLRLLATAALAAACQATSEPPVSQEVEPAIESLDSLALDSLEGHVGEVRAEGFVLEVDDGWLIGFDVDADTHFSVDGAPAVRSDVLRTGEHVVVHFRLGRTYEVELLGDHGVADAIH